MTHLASVNSSLSQGVHLQELRKDVVGTGVHMKDPL